MICYNYKCKAVVNVRMPNCPNCGKPVKGYGMNTKAQFYKGIKLKLIIRDYRGYNAKRYTLNGTNQNVWIPNKHLEDDGTIKSDENLDYVFRKAQNQLTIAGNTEPIIGIKRRTV